MNKSLIKVKLSKRIVLESVKDKFGIRFGADWMCNKILKV